MGLIEGAIGVIIAIVGAALSRLFADEVKEWVPTITQRLIERAARKLPGSYRARLAEEWESHVRDTPGTLSKLIVAVGFQIAARKMPGISEDAGQRSVFVSHSSDDPTIDDIMASIRRVLAEEDAIAARLSELDRLQSPD
jgi:hypothetical protein